MTVQTWTGWETRTLRQALRMSVRDFAEHLGVNERTVSKWEAGQRAVRPRPEMQAALDTALSRASSEAAERFDAAVGRSISTSAGGRYQVRSHKFIPSFIGASTAAVLAGLPAFDPRPHDWLDVSVAELPSADGTCIAHLYACGVMVLHLQQDLNLNDLTSLAAWRYASYDMDLSCAADQVSDLLAAASTEPPGVPEYILSMYVLQKATWAGDELDTALRLMCLPSVLVDRRAPRRPEPVSHEVERRLLAEGFDQAAVIPFGVQGVSLGYAGWSGMSYHALAPERALTTDDLVSCELDIQMLWTYCRHIQRQVEDGRDPVTPPEYGWRFLRAAHSRLTTARTRETTQHCMMRQAALATSGLPERLAQAQAALRETDAFSGRVNA